MNYYKPVFRFFRRPVKRLKVYLKQKAGWLGVPKIIAYHGYGNKNVAFITGRVVEDSGLSKPSDSHKIWHNLLATVKRFSSDEMPGVTVKAIHNNKSQTAVTDEYGFFNFTFKLNGINSHDNKDNWMPVQFELIDPVVEKQKTIKENGEIMLVNENQSRIIVSDIDDTVLISYSTQVLKKLRLMLFKNASTRLPFEGVAELFLKLQKGKPGNKNYPFFFVSSSEWNLYDLLEDFFKLNGLPKGVFLLRKLNYSIYKFWKSGGGNHEHKYEKIKYLLNFYNTKKFVLIGDSGQRDPAIYKRLALEFPGRIEVVYIRKVRSSKVMDLSAYNQDLRGVNTFFKEIKDSHAAIDHAQKHGFVS